MELRQIKARKVWKDYEDSVVQAALTPDGNRAITASIDGLSYIHYVHGTGHVSTKVGAHYKGQNSHDGTISGVAISADGETAASAGMDGRVRIWDSNTAALLHVFGISDCSHAAGVAIANDRKVVVGAYVTHKTFNHLPEATIAVFEILSDSRKAPSARCSTFWKASAARRIRLSVSHDGTLVAYTKAGGVEVVDVNTKRTLSSWNSYGDCDLAMDYAATRLAIADGNSLRICPVVGSGTVVNCWGYVPSIEPAVAFGGNGTRIAAAIEGGLVRVWCGLTGKPLIDLYGPSDDVSALSMSADGAFILGASFDRKSYIWHLRPVKLNSKLIAPKLSCSRRQMARASFRSKVLELNRNDSLLHVQAKGVLESLIEHDDLLFLKKYAVAEIITGKDQKKLGLVDENMFLQCLEMLDIEIVDAKTPKQEELLRNEFITAAGHLEHVVTLPVAASILGKFKQEDDSIIREALVNNSNGTCVSYDEFVRTFEDLKIKGIKD